MQKLMSVMRHAMEKYNMIAPNDCIAVGVSGGKDSISLLAALCEMRRFYPVKYTVKAIIMDPCFDNKDGDYSSIEKLCANYGVECIVIKTQLYHVIFETRKESNPCSMCAKMRRGILHEAAVKYGCNKIALGHNMDDAVETFYMNLFSGGHIGCFSPVTYLSRRDITLIRPLIYAGENDTRRAVKNASLPVIKSGCPADGSTARQETKNLIAELSKCYSALKIKTQGAIERAGIDGWHT